MPNLRRFQTRTGIDSDAIGMHSNQLPSGVGERSDMSDYVEASYALVALAKARAAQPTIANERIRDLLRDCFSACENEAPARREALLAICRLRDLLRHGHTPEEHAWKLAFDAVERWRSIG